jgi:hypothetical protein
MSTMRDSRRYAMARSSRRIPITGEDDETIASVDTSFLRRLIKTGDTSFVDSLKIGSARPMPSAKTEPRPAPMPSKRRGIPRPCSYILVGMMLMYFILYLWEQRHTIEWWKFYGSQMNAFKSTTETTALRGGSYGSPAGMSNRVHDNEEYATSPQLLNFGLGLNSNNGLSSMNRNNGFGELQSAGIIGNNNNNGGVRVDTANAGFGVTSGASNSGFRNTNSLGYGTNTNNANVMQTSNLQQNQQMPVSKYNNVGTTDQLARSVPRDDDVRNSQSTRSLSNTNNIRTNQLSRPSSNNMELGQVLKNEGNRNDRFAGSDRSRQLPTTITSASGLGQLDSVRKQLQAYQPQSNNGEIVSI